MRAVIFRKHSSVRNLNHMSAGLILCRTMSRFRATECCVAFISRKENSRRPSAHGQSRGKVLDVAVDLRGGSPTFGRHVAVELSQDNGRQLFIPRGFAHGFVVLSDEAQFQYKVDNVYAPQAEATLRFDDPALGIDWQIPKADMLLSEKDMRGISLSETAPF